MPAGREQWTQFRGRRPKASEERTRGTAATVCFLITVRALSLSGGKMVFMPPKQPSGIKPCSPRKRCLSVNSPGIGDDVGPRPAYGVATRNAIHPKQPPIMYNRSATDSDSGTSVLRVS
jgi:hypothetical protein